MGNGIEIALTCFVKNFLFECYDYSKLMPIFFIWGVMGRKSCVI
jgi:hypothetical protein